MQAEIRLAESGHSYHYSQLTTVHALMHEIRKDFKIQLEDQKIIMKSGQILKSSIVFHSMQQSMKKTIPTTNSTAFNPSALKSSQMKEIQCLYIYNQKQLLKPIEQKVFNDDFYVKVLRQKCKEMSTLAENSYEFKQFNEKVLEKNIISMIEGLNKKLKTPFQNIITRYSRFYDNLNQRNYSKLQISSLLDLIQNQDKARKLLIRSVEYLFDRKTKKKLSSIKQKITKQIEKQNEVSLKQNSSFFSSQKGSQCSESLEELKRAFGEIETKNTKFYEKLRQSKKQVTKDKFMTEEKITFQIDKKVTSIEKEYEENVKFVKEYFDEFCEEVIKVSMSLIKNKQKEIKDLLKNLIGINEKIQNLETKIQENVKEFTQMYLDLSKIHMKGEAQSIKMVFQTYVELIKAFEDLDVDMRKFEKELNFYKEQKNQEVKISQFTQSRNNNLPLKKNIKSPKKEDKRSQKEDSSVSREVECNMPKINSPIKNKIGKNSLKNFNDEITSKNFEIAIKENKQLSRRLEFNRRLESLMKYCSNLCQKQQQLRRSFRNSKEFQQNKIDLLGFYNVPSIEIDYNQTSDVELTHLYKKWMKENSADYEIEMNWQHQLVEVSNYVTKTLNTYLASKSNATEREKSMERILSVLSETFYKIFKDKLEKEVEKMKKSLQDEVENQHKQFIDGLVKSNQELQEKIKRLEENTLSIESSSIERNISENQQIFEFKYNELLSKNKFAEQENETLKIQVKNLQEKLLSYQEQVNQTTQKLIESYEESNAQEVQKLNQQLKTEKQLNINLNKDIKGARNQLQTAKKNLLKQFQTIESLCDKIEQLTKLNDFYEKQFTDLKNLLADKEVAIIKLEKQLEVAKIEEKQTSKRQGLEQDQADHHQCECSQEVNDLRQKNQELEQEIQNLDRQLKEILFKETLDQEIQTQEEAQYRIKKGKQNLVFQQNKQTSKLIDNKITNQNQAFSDQATKQANLHNFGISNQLNFNTENQAMSQYYISSMGQQQWITSAFNKFRPVSIGKSIQEGMCHVFLPFSSDIYIGVTINDYGKNYTSYQEYLSENMTENLSKEPIYILDLKEFGLKTNQMLRECSLVLVIRVDRKDEVSMGNKIMVSGKIQFALGFEDDDMVIKNYSHFLEE